MSNVVLMELTPPLVIKTIREVLDLGSENIIFTNHAVERMLERNITRLQVMKCLRHGKVTEGPYREVKGNWKFNMETSSCGEPIKVVAALDHKNRNNIIVVITAI